MSGKNGSAPNINGNGYNGAIKKKKSIEFSPMTGYTNNSFTIEEEKDAPPKKPTDFFTKSNSGSNSKIFFLNLQS